MPNFILELKDLSAGYNQSSVIHSINLVINQGELVSLVGSNGAGKSTILKCISKIIAPQSGEILFNNNSITELASHEIVKLGIVQVPEGRRIFPKMTVLENLELGAFVISQDKDSSINSAQKLKDNFEKSFSLFPILKDRLKQLAGTLSGGEQQMLAIARALMSSPKLLLLDEPSMGVAPILVEKIFLTIEKLNSEGLSILLVEQNAHLALEVCHRAYVLSTGKIIMEGEGKELLKDKSIEEAYLGM